jgi:hypothetical protein
MTMLLMKKTFDDSQICQPMFQDDIDDTILSMPLMMQTSLT